MKRKSDFSNWLETSTNLSASSIGKYTGAINTISRGLNEDGKLSGSLYCIIDPIEVEKAYGVYFSIPRFIDKNVRGNNMYSNALKHYLVFTKEKS